VKKVILKRNTLISTTTFHSENFKTGKIAREHGLYRVVYKQPKVLQFPIDALLLQGLEVVRVKRTRYDYGQPRREYPFVEATSIDYADAE
jgi:hypothetical protein